MGVKKVGINHMLQSDRFFDASMARAVFGSVEHFAKAQGQTLINHMAHSSLAVSSPAFASLDRYTLVRTDRVRLSRRPDGTSFDLHCEIAATNSEEPDEDLGELIITITPGDEAPATPDSVPAVSRANVGITEANRETWVPFSNRIRLSLTPELKPVVGVRRIASDLPVYTTEYATAVISVFHKRKIAVDVAVLLSGLYVKEVV